MRKRHAEISGGGIAGLAAGAALARRGWSVCIHERARQVRADGAGIYVWENGLRVLEALGAFQIASEGAHWGSVRETRDPQNRTIARHVFDVARHGRVMSVHRQQLLEALRSAAQDAGAQLVTDSAAVAARPGGALVLADGTERPADLVVAADGVNSKVRDSLELLRTRRRLNDGAIRFTVPRTESERTSEEWQKYVEFWNGTRRILYTPCDANTVYLAITSLRDDSEARAQPFPKDVWIRDFPHLSDVLERISSQGRWADFEVIKLTRWSAGKVAVIGDAAHAQAPNLGQGGGCALMGALSLAHYVDAESDMPSALQTWEKQERPLVEHTQGMSSLLSAITSWPEGLRSTALALAGRSKWFNRQRWRTAIHHPTGAG